MILTGNTASVLRNAPYREADRMLTLFSPTQGRIEALCRGCRKPRSAFRNASEIFALGEYDLYQKGNHLTVVSATLTETFFPLRQDYDRLRVGTYLLSLCESVIQQGQNHQELFMLLLHTLSRLTFTQQETEPLLCGFLVHFCDQTGIKPRLHHCIHCGKRMGDESNAWFDMQDGGLVCADCRMGTEEGIAVAEISFLRMALSSGSSHWVNAPECYAPLRLMRKYTENSLEHAPRGLEEL